MSDKRSLVRHRTRQTKGCLSQDKTRIMIFIDQGCREKLAPPAGPKSIAKTGHRRKFVNGDEVATLTKRRLKTHHQLSRLLHAEVSGDPRRRRLRSTDVIDLLYDLFILRGVPGHVRLDNGPEFFAKSVQAWIRAVGRQGPPISNRAAPVASRRASWPGV